MLSGFGLGMSNEELIASRDAGVLLIGLGIINWTARDAVGAPLRGLHSGNILIRVAELVVNGWENAAGMLPAWSAGALVLPLARIIVFAPALRRA